METPSTQAVIVLEEEDTVKTEWPGDDGTRRTIGYKNEGKKAVGNKEKSGDMTKRLKTRTHVSPSDQSVEGSTI